MVYDKKACNLRYKMKHREYLAMIERERYKREKDKILARNKLWRQKPESKIKLREYQHKSRQLPHVIAARKIEQQKYKSRRTIKSRIWKKDNPEKVLKSSYAYYNKIGKKFNYSGVQYRWALHTWSQAVKKLSNNICQICDKPSKHAHHIFPKAKFPQLTFNLNNGIALCVQHHREIHRSVN